MSTAKTQPAARTPLSRGRVLAAAVELADESGVAAVSMRRLAQRLGVVPMALYKHVADKDELLDAMVDAVIGEFEPPDPALGWQDGVRQQLLSARRAVLRHPWARRAIESRSRRTPAVLAHMDTVAGLLMAGGFSADLTHHVMHALGNRIWGFSPEMFDESDQQAAAEGPPDPALMADFAKQYPHIVQIAAAATAGERSDGDHGCDEQFEFEFALDLLLEGAERLRRSAWSSADRAR